MGTDAARNKQQLELSYPMRNGIVQVGVVCFRGPTTGEARSVDTALRTCFAAHVWRFSRPLPSNFQLLQSWEQMGAQRIHVCCRTPRTECCQANDKTCVQCVRVVSAFCCRAGRR